MDYFEHVTPESVGIPSGAILNFLSRMESNGIELHSFMILRHGKICAEGWWKPYSAEIPHSMFSFSKSLASTAIGFAEQEGLLSLEEKLVEIFPDKLPEHPSENLKKITIWHLLTMSCGHQEEVNLMDETDTVKSFLAHPVVYEPGTMYQYNTPGTNMLAAVLLRKTGKSLTEFLRPRLFEPLGMDKVQCAVLPDGVELAGGGFWLRTGDMARFIQFVLQRGEWQGKQLLRKEWFDRACSKQIETAGGIYNGKRDWGVGYGFQYWRCERQNAFRADGAFGQFGVVLPDQDAAVIITAATLRTQELLDGVFEMTGKMQAEPLPEDSRNKHLLSVRLANLRIPTCLPVRDCAEEEALNAVSFVPAENQDTPGIGELIGGAGGLFLRPSENSGMQKLSFEFQEDGAHLHITQQGAEEVLTVGMKGEFVLSRTFGGTFAAAGRWRAKHVLEAEIRRLESPDGARLLFRFDKENLRVESDEILPDNGGLAFGWKHPVLFRQARDTEGSL